MPSNARRIDSAKADYLDPALYEEATTPRLPSLSRGRLLTSLSRGFDLAEGRRPGHAERVAYIGVALAEATGANEATIRDVLYACLLHDVGMAAAMVSSGPSRTRKAASSGMPTAAEWATVLQSITAHCDVGSAVARELGLGDEVATAIGNHHDCWDGTGVPGALSGDRVPVVARIVGVADRLESMIDSDGSPLQIRTNGRRALREMAGNELDPHLAGMMIEITSHDDFWLGLYDSEAPGWLATTDTGPELQGDELFAFLGVISDLIDRRNGRQPGRARRVAAMSERMAIACEMSPQRAQLVGLAALLQDIGTLGVPARFLNKPDILTVEEMAAVQYHPTHARELLSEIPGFGRVSWWVGAHHERIDGKGYPAMLEGEEVPVEAQVIGMCDAYEALTSDRPHRRAISPGDALQIIRGLAESRFEGYLVGIFEGQIDHLVER